MEVLAFILYFAVVLGIGLYFFFTTLEDGEQAYFLGGRKMGPWVTAMSAQASDMSAWLLMGLPGSVLAFGLGQVWIGVGLVLGTALNWLITARRLRKFSKAYGDAITFPQYLSNRFAAKDPTLKILCALVILISFTLYVTTGFIAGAAVFTTLFPDLAKETAMLIFAAIILLYTFFGGYKAVCWTDFFQGFLMLAALLAVPIVIVCTRSLDTAALNAVYSFEKTEYAFSNNPFSVPWQEIVSGLAWGLGYFGMPHILVRFMAIEKPSSMRKAAAVAIVWAVLALTAAIVIGYFGRMFLGEQLLTMGNQKLVFVQMARDLFPGFIAGTLLAAIIAASMSTADSQLLVASSSFTSDIYRPIFRREASEAEIMWIGRLVVLLTAGAAYFLASCLGDGAQAIMDIVGNAWGLFGAAFGPVVLLSLYWRRFTYLGALAGIFLGALTDILWLLYLTSKTGIYEILPGFAVSLVMGVLVSLLTPAPSAKVEVIFERAASADFDE